MEIFMNWTYLSLLIAGVLPVACAGIAKLGFKHYDNHDPRAWLAKQTGFRARANAAQSNSFEAFPFFAAGVLLALLAGADHATIDSLSIGFVVARIAYIGCYVADKATLRSIVWSAGYGCVIALYVLAIKA
jgi:uncharacterized MAPEG superfamily protein